MHPKWDPNLDLDEKPKLSWATRIAALAASITLAANVAMAGRIIQQADKGTSKPKPHNQVTVTTPKQPSVPFEIDLRILQPIGTKVTPTQQREVRDVMEHTNAQILKRARVFLRIRKGLPGIVPIPATPKWLEDHGLIPPKKDNDPTTELFEKTLAKDKLTYTNRFTLTFLLTPVHTDVFTHTASQ